MFFALVRYSPMLRMKGVSPDSPSAMIARGVYGRGFDQHGSLVLSSSEEDYAGWDLSSTPGKATIAPPNFHRAWRENSLVTSASPG